MLIGEDLYQGYHVGFSCNEKSQAGESRMFMCKVVLLLLQGDIPALGKATGFVHQGDFHCHWCMQQSKKNPVTNRHYCADFRRWLPQDSMMRAAGGNFLQPELRLPPPLRQHRNVVRQGLQGRDYTGAEDKHPKILTGIRDWCPLCFVPGFDIVWDVVGDFMHAVKWYPSHLVSAMNGKTQLAPPRILQLQLKRGLSEAEVADRHRINETRLEEHRRHKEAMKGIFVAQEQRDLVDARFSRLLGEGGIGRQDKTIFRKMSTMLTSDWQHFLQYCDPYVFQDILPEPYNSTYFQITGIYRSILAFQCNVKQTEDEAKLQVSRLEHEISAALVAFERVFPSALLSGPVIHTLVHYPAFMFRWNSVRNYWCYFNERYNPISQ